MSFWYFSWAELLQQSMNLAQNQFFHSSFTSLLLWGAVISSSKLPEMGNVGLSSNGDPQALCWTVRHYQGRGRQDPLAHRENPASLETSVYSFMRKKKKSTLSSVGPQHWGRDRSFPETWRHKKRRNCVSSQNETRHESFQTGIFSLAFPTAFEAFHWKCCIFPLQLQRHNLSMLVHSHWFINFMIFPLMGPDSSVVRGVKLLSPLRLGARDLRSVTCTSPTP